MIRTLRLWFGLIIPVALILLAGCTRLDPPGPEQPLVVGLPADPVFQQAAPPSEGMDGFSRDLAEAFAEVLGVKLRYVVAPNYPALLEMVRNGKVHLAVAVPTLGATVPAAGDDPQLIYSPPLLETRQLIVQHASALRVDSATKLAGREIAVPAGALQAQVLRAMNIEPPPVIVERADINELELLGGVARRHHELVASTELHFAVASNYYPDLAIAFELPEKLSYVWAISSASPTLIDCATRFIESARQEGLLRRLNDRYFGHIRRMDARDSQVFLEHVRSRLPTFRQEFHAAQEITGIDWRLLAALAYQESKWDPLATSPTGVRGMMMLTEDTADRLKVTNRLDPSQSIHAGARYLAMLRDDLPAGIEHPDRLWFALAAYNLGMGHMNGARAFAPGLKRDPDDWYDMKQVLPLMARPEYYTRLKSGRARGGEAVILVENVRNYFDVLSRFEPIHTPPSLGGSLQRKLRGLNQNSQVPELSSSNPPM
ncbi:MAG: membrane-bound lytic murein transglycosylase MltF [Gammaproteobacteria bacterium]|nr:membrane-bound lytic murein transglycosylase MltF [Gammaproteobacteria bacterium]MBU3989268.1 membrane-bound lytic murein transglycosylase MltF [Gammaproteobacteria bacterium]MBU4005253.1 membrane-bound lytic murein transglycosylase MltF [Gammaproteobacteria bacterium]MBU4022432.1 membrane-bound lytic murein transglycosylase MltF [Gammaproteobacteria bacterium]MBU4097739.1 membrane-bound lytic murein transglycosylase MltF [Gammaproteobacteria bacterium]